MTFQCGLVFICVSATSPAWGRIKEMPDSQRGVQGTMDVYRVSILLSCL